METKGWFFHFEMIVIFFSILGGFFTVNNMLSSQIQSVREEISFVREDVAGIRHENLVQCSRTDKLYEMFIDLLKENKKT